MKVASLRPPPKLAMHIYIYIYIYTSLVVEDLTGAGKLLALERLKNLPKSHPESILNPLSFPISFQDDF